MKICIYTKQLRRDLDEGIMKVSDTLARGLSNKHQILMVYSVGDAEKTPHRKKIPLNASFISYTLRRELRTFHPDVVLYVPRASASLLNLWRARVLKWYGHAEKSIMFVLQPNELNSLSKILVPLVKPDLILSPSRKDCRDLVKKGCNAKFIPLGIDLEKFYPVTPIRKAELRKKYGVEDSAFIVLHVGHINRNRNIELLKLLQASGNQVVMVASTSVSQDTNLLRELTTSGVRVFTEFMADIEEMYQLSDCYIFPTISETGCISIPLSVLEAMACNLPVITTKFGGLTDIFPTEVEGLVYCDTPEEFVDRVGYFRENISKVKFNNQKLVEPYSWETCLNAYLRIINTI
jgi:glycosyltransferase involved in cell wall biosynthesis